MKQRKVTSTEVLTQVNAQQMIASVGIWLMTQANIIEHTDAVYGSGFLEEFATEMRLFSLCLHECMDAMDKFGLELHVTLPDGIGAIEVPNPLHIQNVGKSPSDDDDNPDVALGDIPF